MTSSPDRVVATVLAAGLLLAGVGSAAAVPAATSTPGVDAGALPDDPTDDGGNATDAGDAVEETVDDDGDTTGDTTDSTTNTSGSTDGTTDSTDETTDETTDSVTETVENATNTTGETTNTTDGTVDETEETVGETRDTVSDAVEETAEAADETTEAIEDTTEAIEDATNETSLTSGTTGRLSADTRLTAGTSDESGVERDATTGDASDTRTTAGDAGMDGDGTGDAGANGGDETDETAAANAPGDEGGGGTVGASTSGGGSIPPSPGPVDPVPATGAGAVAVGGAAVALAGRRYGLSAPSATAAVSWTDAAAARTFGRYAIERLREHGWRLLALFGYERYAGDPLDHDLRARINEAIRGDPGIHLSAVAETADAPLGTVRYHLKRLEAEGLIESETSDGRRRYVPAGADLDALETALRDDAPRAVLEALFEGGPASTTELADRIDRDPSTATHHVERLAEAGLVERERDGRAVESRLSDGVRAALARRRAGTDAGAGAGAGGRPAATTD